MPDSLQDFDFVEALHRMTGWERTQIENVIEQAQSMDMLYDLMDALRADDRDHVNDILRQLPPEQSKYDMANEELSESFGIGDEVLCHGKQKGKIKVPNGPGKTVGVMIDGELQMFEKKHVKPVNEGVLGMSALPGIQRMRELAGMPSINEDEMSAILGDHPPPSPAKPALPPAPMGDSPDAPMDAGLVGGGDLGGADLGGDLGGDDLGDDLGGMDAVAPAPAPAAPVGAGPDLGMDAGMGVADAAPMPVNSPAYSQIEDALNNIQRQLSDIKISEYKPLVKRMQDLAAQAQEMGKQYLGEAIRRAEAKKKAITEKKSFRDYLKK